MKRKGKKLFNRNKRIKYRENKKRKRLASDVDSRPGMSYAPTVGSVFGAAAGGTAAYSAGTQVSQALSSGSAFGAAEVDSFALDMFGADILADLNVAAAMSGPMAAGVVAGGAALGYLAGSALQSLFAKQKSSVTSIMSGTYQGRISNLTSRKKKGIRDYYQKNGVVFIREITGVVADPDLVGVGHISYDINTCCKVIACAILRKLIKKGFGLDVETVDEELKLLSYTDSLGARLTFQKQKSNGDPISTDYTLVDNQSLAALAVVSGLFQIIYDMMTQTEPESLESIAISVQDTSTTIAYRTRANLNMKREVIELGVQSHCIIQNRTKTATGSSGTDQNDAQPLKGPCYEFKGVPQTKEQIVKLLNTTYTSGVMLMRTGALTSSDQLAYKEPPVAKAFNNVIKTGYCRINPGNLKDMAVGSRWRGYFKNIILNKLRVITKDGLVTQCPGNAQIVFLEEEMNSGSANNITVNYEIQHTVGAVLYTTKAPNCQPGYDTGVQDLVPP